MRRRGGSGLVCEAEMMKIRFVIGMGMGMGM
jgi:hypothetical protein